MTPIQLAEPLARWFEERGCERLSTPDLAVGHGVLAPAVFFSLLGAEDCRTVHLQPIRRPADARPRLHPHRLAVHHQVYAILGAEGPPPLEILAGVLGALGLDPADHDLRLRARRTDQVLAGVEAAGWALQVDGIDVGRTSWMVAVGGAALARPTLEVALGVERLAVVLPDEARGRATASSRLRAWEEEELAGLGLELAGVDRLAARFESLVAEAGAALDGGLALTALRSLLEAAQVAETLEQRDPSARRRGDLERRVATGIARCAAVGAERYRVEPGLEEGG